MSVLSFILKKNYQIYDLSKPKKEFYQLRYVFKKTMIGIRVLLKKIKNSITIYFYMRIKPFTKF